MSLSEQPQVAVRQEQEQEQQSNGFTLGPVLPPMTHSPALSVEIPPPKNNSNSRSSSHSSSSSNTQSGRFQQRQHIVLACFIAPRPSAPSSQSPSTEENNNNNDNNNAIADALRGIWRVPHDKSRLVHRTTPLPPGYMDRRLLFVLPQLDEAMCYPTTRVWPSAAKNQIINSRVLFILSCISMLAVVLVHMG
eukprot:PhM_4_TR6279/c2_g1_i2/m.30230